jgi:hypothetical protein
MATSVASIEPAYIAMPPIEDATAFIRQPQAFWDATAQATTVEPPDSPDEDEDEQPRTMRNIRANLGDSILLSAVQDYMGADERNHRSAELFLYPTDEHYTRHLRWVCGMTSFPLHYLRATLDRLRPRWDRARRNKKAR